MATNYDGFTDRQILIRILLDMDTLIERLDKSNGRSGSLAERVAFLALGASVPSTVIAAITLVALLVR